MLTINENLTGEPNAKANRWRYLVILGAISLFFATIEYLIPKPIPFFRIGLANLPLILALPYFRWRELSWLCLVKVIGQGIIGGTLISYVFLFSALGTFASLGLMFTILHLSKGRVSWVMLSLAGALGSNLVQMCLSLSFIFGISSLAFAPFLYLVGLVAGLLVGLAADILAQRSKWYAGFASQLSLCNPTPQSWIATSNIFGKGGPIIPKVKKRLQLFRLQLPPHFDFLSKHISPRTHLILAIAIIPAFILQNRLDLRCIEMALWMILALLAGKRLQPLFFLFMASAIIFFNLFNPAGRELLRLGPFLLTEYALREGLLKASGIIGLIMISLAAVKPGLRLPGGFGLTLTRSLVVYQYLLKERGNLPGLPILEGIDKVLEKSTLHLIEVEKIPNQVIQGDTPIGLAITGLLILGHYLLVLF